MIEERFLKLKYFGKFDGDGAGSQAVTIKHSNGNTTGLKHVVVHSPTGLNWGYAGSGPADCALSILSDFCVRTRIGKKIATQNYQAFKFAFVAKFGDSFELTGKQIVIWLINNHLILGG